MEIKIQHLPFEQYAPFNLFVMKKIILFFLPTVILFSCSQNKSAQNTITADSLQTKASSQPKEVELEGLYTNHLIISCTDNEKIAVTGAVNKLDSLYKSLLPQSYSGQTIYVKVKGLLVSQGNSKELAVKEVLRAEQKNDRNTCVSYDYWCMGNEPFWQIQISEKENLIDFFDPMANKYYHFNFSKPESKQNVTIYTAESGSNKIKVSITNEKCSDGMSEREYLYKSEVLLNGTTYKGCAVASSSGVK